ncbi:MAG: hypothetical protein QNJ18_17525 [Xenococcaceae cyanobacterium MO_167.B52]|nr:hypothetical protein [Xenococcaceae cyanobacterium MO_167.B52]
MRRRTFSRQKTDVELFPFLSILACTIGTLILLIIVLTTQNLTQSEVIAEQEKDLNQHEKQVKIIAKDQAKNGTNKSKNPVYIECREDGVILYPQKTFVSQAELTSYSSPLQELITLIKMNKDQEYLIIAVRPKGVNVFKQVRNLVEEAEIDMGYEPIDEDWELLTGEEVINEAQK